jgi:hypothetical protein
MKYGSRGKEGLQRQFEKERGRVLVEARVGGIFGRVSWGKFDAFERCGSGKFWNGVGPWTMEQSCRLPISRTLS